MNRSYAIALPLLFIIAFTSCDKKRNLSGSYDQGTGQCGISTVTSWYGTDITYKTRFYYDDQRRISDITYNFRGVNSYSHLEYFDHSVVVHRLDSVNRETVHDTLVFNDAHKMIFRGLKNINDAYVYWAELFYDTHGSLSRIDYRNSPGTFISGTETYHWNNGDMVQFENSIYTYHYNYLQRPNQLYLSSQIGEIDMIGMAVWSGVHLPDGEYTFDSEGKVTKQITYNSSGALIGHKDFTYQCN